ncbi:MAG: tryptophan--tRNA ligase [Clostridium sp.]|nr:tryptophan--tRNA ligase [Clostridium sp.]MDY3828316.1 tryptophan--tRNA ligase [Clostridium sp.]
MDKKVILTGDRPTGKLHIGHYVGSLRNRVELQNSGLYESFIMIADQQALTDNARNPEKIRNSLIQVALDYLSVGIDPTKSTIFVQSQIPELHELTMQYLNLVTVSRLYRNPTVKEEIKQKEFNNSIPAGFFIYPVSQAADITAFKAEIVPVGDDQLPMIEQAREIVRTFNSLYGEVLVEPKAVLPPKGSGRLPGTDGKAKMSKSIGNCIYLSDDADTVRKKVMSMYTDPNHIRVEDPGQVEGNTVFTYLDAFCKEKDVLEEMKEHYTRGGLGDVKVKKYLNEVLQAELEPIRKRRAEYESDIDEIYNILKKGSDKAREIAAATLKEVREVIGLEYFNR